VRQFASSGFRIWNLGREAKLVYTGFGIFALLAIFVSILFYEDLVGPRSAGVAGYYAGTAAHAGANSSANEGANSNGGSNSAAATGNSGAGPRIELDEAAEARPIVVAVTYRKLLEVTHFHLFTVPVFLLIIAHLFMLTGLGPSLKLTFIVTGFASSLLHLVAPWAIRYGGAGWAWLYPLTGGAMALSLTFMTAYPIVVMWRAPAEAKSRA
jgi:hypothetical protein